MATQGRLGAADLAATTNTVVYTCPTSTFSVVAVNVLNRTTSAVSVRLAISTGASPGNAEYIEYDIELPSNGVLERSGIVLSANQTLVAYASGTGISVNVYGIETDISAA